MSLLGNVQTMHDKLIHQRLVYQNVAAGHLKNVTRLLGQKPREFDVPNEFGISPIMIAASNGHETVVDLLIDMGEKVAPAAARSALKAHPSSIYRRPSLCGPRACMTCVVCVLRFAF